MINECRLTTSDNPYNPFNQFNEWFLFDVEHGYNCCGYVARIAMTSDALSDDENREEVERAIDEIIQLNPLIPYKKVSRPPVTEY